MAICFKENATKSLIYDKIFPAARAERLGNPIRKKDFRAAGIRFYLRKEFRGVRGRSSRKWQISKGARGFALQQKFSTFNGCMFFRCFWKKCFFVTSATNFRWWCCHEKTWKHFATCFHVFSWQVIIYSKIETFKKIINFN